MAEKIVNPTKENIKMFDVKFLIENEDNINWEQLSAIKERSFSIPEIKMFGKRISWIMYIYNHDMTQEEINVAEKYFKEPHIYKVISEKNLTEDFIFNNKDKLYWPSILRYSDLSEKFIFDTLEYWNKYDMVEIKKSIKDNIFIDLDSKEFNRLVLFLKLKS